MFGGGGWGGRARAASTAARNAFSSALGRLPSHAASISFTRVDSAARRSFSNFECFVTTVSSSWDLNARRPPAESQAAC